MSVTKLRNEAEPEDVNIYEHLDPETVKAFLDDRFKHHIIYGRQLLGGVSRMPATITDEGVADKAANLREMIRTAIADTDATRVAVKEPVWQAVKQIDGAGREICEPLVAAGKLVGERITAYLAAKDTAERDAARIAAERLAKEAVAAAMDGVAEEDAIALGDAALAAQERVEAAPAERIRTQLGVTTALKYEYVYAGVSDLSKVPRELLMLNEALVKLKIKQGATEIPGIVIERKAKLTK